MCVFLYCICPLGDKVFRQISLVAVEREYLAQDQIETDDEAPIANLTANVRNGNRKSSFPLKIVDACHSGGIDKDRKHKTRISWLKDPKLYAVRLWNEVTKHFFLFSFYLVSLSFHFYSSIFTII